MSVTASGAGTTTVRLHRLTMVPEDDGVMVGRPDIGSYALFPPEGAETLRRLDTGAPVAEVAAWYEREYGDPLDFDDFLEIIDDLQFVLADGEEAPPPPRIRWQRLGRWAFSTPAMAGYAALIGATVVEMVRKPGLRPSFHHLFFTTHLSLIPILLTAALIPSILWHEAFHALAGRRLGLPSTLSISRRFYYLVAETKLDSLLSVPRRKRYLPFLAGMLADFILISTLTLLGAAMAGPGAAGWIGGLFLAIAFTSVLRLIWQLMFYLQTDLYFVFATALRCADLQNAARFVVKTQVRRLLRREPPRTDDEWTDRDRTMARWYAPLLVLGYGFSLASLLWAGLPATINFWTMIIGRFRSSTTTTEGIVDAVTFIVLTLWQPALLGYVFLRDRRARARTNSPEGATT